MKITYVSFMNELHMYMYVYMYSTWASKVLIQSHTYLVQCTCTHMVLFRSCGDIHWLFQVPCGDRKHCGDREMSPEFGPDFPNNRKLPHNAVNAWTHKHVLTSHRGRPFVPSIVRTLTFLKHPHWFCTRFELQTSIGNRGRYCSHC